MHEPDAEWMHTNGRSVKGTTVFLVKIGCVRNLGPCLATVPPDRRREVGVFGLRGRCKNDRYMALLGGVGYVGFPFMSELTVGRGQQ